MATRDQAQSKSRVGRPIAAGAIAAPVLGALVAAAAYFLLAPSPATWATHLLSVIGIGAAIGLWTGAFAVGVPLVARRLGTRRSNPTRAAAAGAAAAWLLLAAGMWLVTRDSTATGFTIVIGGLAVLLTLFVSRLIWKRFGSHDTHATTLASGPNGVAT